MRSLCCQRSVYLISVSLIRATLHDFLQRNCLRSLSSSTFFLFFPPSLTFCFISCLFSIFPINILLFLSPALVSCPPGATMWQGKMGWSRARQVNRLKSAGEAWRFIQCVCTGWWARKCVCVCVCVLKFGTSSQSYVSKVAPSVAVIFPSVCCHFLSCPYQPSLFLFVSDRSFIVFSFFFLYFRSFPVLLSRQWFVTAS